MADFCYRATFNRALTGALNLESGTYKMLLLTTEDTESVDHATVAAVLAAGTNDECADGSYARQTLAYTGTTNQAGSVEDDDTNDRAEWHFDDVAYSFSASQSPVAAIVYLDVDGTDANAVPYFHWDISATGTSLTVQVGAEGAVHAKAAA